PPPGDHQPRALVDLVVAELRAGVEVDRDGAPLGARVQDLRLALPHVDRRHVPGPHRRPPASAVTGPGRRRTRPAGREVPPAGRARTPGPRPRIGRAASGYDPWTQREEPRCSSTPSTCSTPPSRTARIRSTP